MIKEISLYLKRHGFETLSPKAVLFDMDGVLYNSMPNHAIAWRQAMRSFGIDMTEHDAYATEGARGIDTIRNMVKQQQHRIIDNKEAQAMYDEKTRLFHLLPQPPVMEGIPELMAQIKADGLTIGVVTGSGQRPLISRLLTDFGDYLDEQHIVTAYDVERGKPAPDPYLMGLKKAGNLKPWEAYVVENAPLGVIASVAAHIFTIAVNTGPLPMQILSDAGADLCLDRMTDLSKKWKHLTATDQPPISQDNRWEQNYQTIMQFMTTHQRRPSKHRIEEHRMLNWVKYNKKLIARGELSADRIDRFNELMALAEQLTRINQFAYKTPQESNEP